MILSIPPAWSTHMSVSLRKGQGTGPPCLQGFPNTDKQRCQSPPVISLVAIQSHFKEDFGTKVLIRSSLGVKGYFSKKKKNQSIPASRLTWHLNPTGNTYFKPLTMTDFLNEELKAMGYLFEQAWEMGGDSARRLNSGFPSFPKMWQVQLCPLTPPCSPEACLRP